MIDATRHRRAGIGSCLIFVALVLAIGTIVAPAESTTSYCDRALQVVNGYLAPQGGVVVALELSSSPGVIVASPTTASDGTWCATLSTSGNYNVTVGTGAKELNRFVCLSDLLPSPCR